MSKLADLSGSETSEDRLARAASQAQFDGVSRDEWIRAYDGAKVWSSKYLSALAERGASTPVAPLPARRSISLAQALAQENPESTVVNHDDDQSKKEGE